jgi:hypothetical protein
MRWDADEELGAACYLVELGEGVLREGRVDYEGDFLALAVLET